MTRERPHGWGRVEQRTNRAGLLVWYIRWWDGRDRHQSVARALRKAPAEVTETEAHRLLDRRLKEKLTGTSVEPRTARMTVRQLLDAYAGHLVVKGIKSQQRMRNELATLKRWCGDLPVAALTTARLTEMVGDLLERGRVVKGGRGPLARTTVKTRLSWLHAAMVFGSEQLGLPAVPRFPPLKLPPARRVMISASEFEQILPGLRAHGPADDVALFGFLTGWRISEVLGLTWDRVDRDPWRVRLDDTKTGDPRERQAEPELQALLAERRRQRVFGCPFVFHRRGTSISLTWFYRQWRTACAQAGVPDRRFHDFRRAGYAQLMAAGVDLFTAMALIGHKSASVAQRYNIVDTTRQTEALRKLTEYRARERHSRKTRARGDAGEAGSS